MTGLPEVAASAVEGAFKEVPERDQCDLLWFLFKACRLQAVRLFGHAVAAKMLAAQLGRANDEAARVGCGPRRRA